MLMVVMRMKLNFTRKRIRVVLGWAGIVVVIGLAGVMMFSAASNVVKAYSGNDRTGPNPDWYGHSARFVLENDSNVVGSGSMTVPIFIMNTGPVDTAPQYPPTNVTVKVYDFYKGYRGASVSSVTVTYKRTFNTATNSCSNGSTSAATVGSSDRTFTIDRRCFVYRADINGWYSNTVATLGGNSGIIHFRMAITSPTAGNEIIGYEADTSKFAIGARHRCDSGGDTAGCWSYFNYSIPFGTPCSESAGHDVTAYIYDPDNPSGSAPYGIQPSGFGVSVRNVTNGGNSPVSISVTGSGGNGGQYNIRFRVDPSQKYKFNINGVYTNNVLQFKLPYDSIEAIANCAWEIEPEIDVNTDSVEPPINGVNISPVVNNKGPGAASAVNWQLTKCIVPRNASAAASSKAADNTSNGVNTYNALGASCQQLATASNQGFAKGRTPVSTLTNQTIDDAPVGTKICYLLSVNRPIDTSASNVWRHSIPKCVLVVKKPKIEVIGSDLIVGTGSSSEKNVQGATTQKLSGGVVKTFGSWVEYGIVASGTVSKVASGAGYSKGTDLSGFCNVSLLTFSNATQSGATSVCQDSAEKGNYASVKKFPNIAARMSTNTSVPILGTDIDLGVVSKGIYTTNATSLVVRSTQTIAKGKWVIVYAPNATVTMAQNISYTNEALQKAADIPQVLIVANSIDIQGGVSNLDAWLIASGEQGIINTCSDVSVTTALTESLCNNKLTVNGPVVSKALYLRRTAGSSSTIAAETFNLRPDAYLWATDWTASAGRLQTVYSKELPPRF